jgi:hypothetical protein
MSEIPMMPLRISLPTLLLGIAGEERLGGRRLEMHHPLLLLNAAAERTRAKPVEVHSVHNCRRTLWLVYPLSHGQAAM